jgi:hypothetical protein
MQSRFSIKGEGSNNNDNDNKKPKKANAGNRNKRTEEEKLKIAENMRNIIKMKKTNPQKLKEERIDKAAGILFDREMKINKTKLEINKTNNSETLDILSRRLIGLTKKTNKRIENEEIFEIKARAQELLDNANKIAAWVDKAALKRKARNALTEKLEKERKAEKKEKYKQLAVQDIITGLTDVNINAGSHKAIDRMAARLYESGNEELLKLIIEKRNEQIKKQINNPEVIERVARIKAEQAARTKAARIKAEQAKQSINNTNSTSTETSMRRTLSDTHKSLQDQVRIRKKNRAS